MIVEHARKRIEGARLRLRLDCEDCPAVASPVVVEGGSEFLPAIKAVGEARREDNEVKRFEQLRIDQHVGHRSLPVVRDNLATQAHTLRESCHLRTRLQTKNVYPMRRTEQVECQRSRARAAADI